MPTDQEIQRLVEVYRSYGESRAIQGRWDDGNPGNRAILRERQRAVRSWLAAHSMVPLAGRQILEVGCGSGRVLAGLLELGARPENLHGVDLLPERIAVARQHHPDIDFQLANAEELGFADAQFDLVLLFTVFSSILDDAMAHNIAREVIRVLKPGGAVVWYDLRYDNPRNPNVRGMPATAVRALFPGFDLHIHTVTLLPPLARRLGRATPVLYPALALIPALRTHYLGLLVKRL